MTIEEYLADIEKQRYDVSRRTVFNLCEIIKMQEKLLGKIGDYASIKIHKQDVETCIAL